MSESSRNLKGRRRFHIAVYSVAVMRKSASVTLTVAAMVGAAARGQQRPDPCDALTFNEQACQAAVQNRGYCWNGRWVHMRYHNPFPYFYDNYQEYASQGGVALASTYADRCGHGVWGTHGGHGGFGATAHGGHHGGG